MCNYGANTHDDETWSFETNIDLDYWVKINTRWEKHVELMKLAKQHVSSKKKLEDDTIQELEDFNSQSLMTNATMWDHLV